MPLIERGNVLQGRWITLDSDRLNSGIRVYAAATSAILGVVGKGTTPITVDQEVFHVDRASAEKWANRHDKQLAGPWEASDLEGIIRDVSEKQAEEIREQDWLTVERCTGQLDETFIRVPGHAFPRDSAGKLETVRQQAQEISDPNMKNQVDELLEIGKQMPGNFEAQLAILKTAVGYDNLPTLNWQMDEKDFVRIPDKMEMDSPVMKGKTEQGIEFVSVQSDDGFVQTFSWDTDKKALKTIGGLTKQAKTRQTNENFGKAVEPLPSGLSLPWRSVNDFYHLKMLCSEKTVTILDDPTKKETVTIKLTIQTKSAAKR